VNQQVGNCADEINDLHSQLVQVIKLALNERNDDLRLYVARVVRKLRSGHPETAQQLEAVLKTRPPARPATPFRRGSLDVNSESPQVVPVDEESKLSLLKVFKPDQFPTAPMLSDRVRLSLEQLINERRRSTHLAELGLQPTKSAVFVGQPGVGKTLTARWVAQQLGLPLFVLDLTAVMSSLLGRSGTNLRSALDFAKRIPCVLLLDEIDSIAKRRSDEADIGELKRLVTVILQEVDEWPSSGLLLAATNHPELIDPALWRRFDLVVEFDSPSPDEVEQAVIRFLGSDGTQLQRWTSTLGLLYRGNSYSDIERDMNRLRRNLALGSRSEEEMVHTFVQDKASALGHNDRIELASKLVAECGFSQHSASALTGVSRDTIRKRVSRS
jgi:MoxR-like ATPase